MLSAPKFSYPCNRSRRGGSTQGRLRLELLSSRHLEATIDLYNLTRDETRHFL